MGYKGDSWMDCGYFMGGHPGGLIYIPPTGSKEEPGIIPWSVLLPEDGFSVRRWWARRYLSCTDGNAAT